MYRLVGCRVAILSYSCFNPDDLCLIHTPSCYPSSILAPDVCCLEGLHVLQTLSCCPSLRLVSDFYNNNISSLRSARSVNFNVDTLSWTQHIWRELFDLWCKCFDILTTAQAALTDILPNVAVAGIISLLSLPFLLLYNFYCQYLCDETLILVKFTWCYKLGQTLWNIKLTNSCLILLLTIKMLPLPRLSGIIHGIVYVYLSPAVDSDGDVGEKGAKCHALLLWGFRQHSNLTHDIPCS